MAGVLVDGLDEVLEIALGVQAQRLVLQHHLVGDRAPLSFPVAK